MYGPVSQHLIGILDAWWDVNYNVCYSFNFGSASPKNARKKALSTESLDPTH